MFKPFAKTIVLINLIVLACACKPTVPPPPASTSTPETPNIIPTITPMQVLTSTTTPTQALTPTTTPTPPEYLEQVAVLDLPNSFVNTIIFSPDSQTMITGDRNGEVLVWERDTWEKTIFLPARSTYTADDAAGIWYWGTLLLSPDGNMIVHAYGDNGTVTGYDHTGQVMFTYSFGSRVWAVAISPDGRLLAVSGLQNNVVIFDLETYKQMANLVSDYEYIFNLVFSPDGKTLVVGYERPGNVIKLWDTATWQETSTFTHVSQRIDYHDILFTPDGTQLLLADHMLGDPIGVRIWDLASSQVVWEFRQNSEAAYQIALSPDGSLLASVHEALQIWNLETRAPVKTIQVPNRELGAVAFSPDGTLIAFSVWGEGVQIWKVTQYDRGSEPQTAADQVTWLADVTNYIDGLASEDQFAGAVIIALNGEPLLAKAYGLADRSRNISNQVDTQFNLGSMNKMFTAVSILQLVEQSRLSLDKTILDILPDYPNSTVAGAVTVEQLLTHTSGMGDCFTGDFFTTPAEQLKTVEGYLPLFVNKPLQFAPGTQYSYSNEGYIVLGLIIEKITGQSYFDYVRENIYSPAGMGNTDAFELDAVVSNLAIGYTTQDAEGNETGILTDNIALMPIKGTPAGGGYSTVEDLLNFSEALLGFRLLTPEATELLLAGKVEIRESVRYAYGFMDKMIEGQRVVGHGGNAPGVCNFMDMYLDLGYTIIILSNTDEGCLSVREFIRENPLRTTP